MQKLNSIAVTEETSVTEGDTASVGSAVGSPEVINEDSEASFDKSDIALETDHIDIAGFEKEKGAEKDKEYLLSIKRKISNNKSITINDTRGDWESSTGPTNIPGINITQNTFTVDQRATRNTNVEISYVVNGKKIISRTIKIK